MILYFTLTVVILLFCPSISHGQQFTLQQAEQGITNLRKSVASRLDSAEQWARGVGELLEHYDDTTLVDDLTTNIKRLSDNDRDNDRLVELHTIVQSVKQSLHFLKLNANVYHEGLEALENLRKFTGTSEQHNTVEKCLMGHMSSSSNAESFFVANDKCYYKASPTGSPYDTAEQLCENVVSNMKVAEVTGEEYWAVQDGAESSDYAVFYIGARREHVSDPFVFRSTKQEVPVNCRSTSDDNCVMVFPGGDYECMTCNTYIPVLCEGVQQKTVETCIEEHRGSSSYDSNFFVANNKCYYKATKGDPFRGVEHVCQNVVNNMKVAEVTADELHGVQIAADAPEYGLFFVGAHRDDSSQAFSFRSTSQPVAVQCDQSAADSGGCVMMVPDGGYRCMSCDTLLPGICEEAS